jgi:hypothetical protein
MVRQTPARWVNLLHKDYWLREENWPRAEFMLTRRLDQLGAAIFLLLFLLGLLTLRRTCRTPSASGKTSSGGYSVRT